MNETLFWGVYESCMKHALQTGIQSGAKQHGKDRGVCYFSLKHNKHTSFALPGEFEDMVRR